VSRIGSKGREAFVRTARAAEELGYDSVWSGDHIVYPVQSSWAYPYPRPLFDTATRQGHNPDAR